jgi:uncharacterized protein YpmB
MKPQTIKIIIIIVITIIIASAADYFYQIRQNTQSQKVQTGETIQQTPGASQK